MSNNDTVDSLVQHWMQAKEQIVQLEHKIDKYKRLANKLLDKQGVDMINTSEYILKRSNVSRSSMSKDDVPETIWKQYSHTCTYPVYTIKCTKKY